MQRVASLGDPRKTASHRAVLGLWLAVMLVGPGAAWALDVKILSPSEGEEIYPEIEDVFVRAEMFWSDEKLDHVEIHVDDELVLTQTVAELLAAPQDQPQADEDGTGEDTGSVSGDMSLPGPPEHTSGSVLVHHDVDSQELSEGPHTVTIKAFLADGGTAEGQVEFHVNGRYAARGHNPCIVFLDRGKNEVDVLKVAKWERAFTGSGIQKLFIKGDVDHFYVRVTDNARKGAGSFFITIETDYKDPPHSIKLKETANLGEFDSEAQMLVSDHVDDAQKPQKYPYSEFAGRYVVDESDHDPTHKVKLGNKVTATYTPPGGAAHTASADVPKKEVTVHVHILMIAKDWPSVKDIATLKRHLRVATERYAQVGIAFKFLGPDYKDLPAGVKINAPWGLRVRTSWGSTDLHPDAEAVLKAHGTPDTQKDIHVFYVSKIRIPGAPGWERGSAVAEYHYGGDEKDYFYNVFIGTLAIKTNARFDLPHELTHSLANSAGTRGRSAPFWNILNHPVDRANTYRATKRITEAQEKRIYDAEPIK